jgi:hypothetical protein
VLWEALAGRRLYGAMNEAELVSAVMAGAVTKLTDAVDQSLVSPDRWELLQKLEPIVGKGLAFAMEGRFATAAEMQDALLKAAPIATPAEVSKCVKLLGKEYLEGREKVIVSEESSWRRQKLAGPDVPVDDVTERSAPGSAPGVASQPSATATALQTSVMAPVPAPPRGRAQWATVGVLLLIGGLLGAILLLLMRSPQDAAPASGATTSTVSTTPTTLAAAPSPVVAAAPIATATTSADSGAAPIVPATPVHATPTFPAAQAAPRAAAPTPQPAPASDCNPPFYFDGKKKIFKPGCL